MNSDRSTSTHRQRWLSDASCRVCPESGDGFAAADALVQR
jgi:hypothetical protein